MACTPAIPGCSSGNDTSSPLGKFAAILAVVSGLSGFGGFLTWLAGLGLAGGATLGAIAAAVAIVLVISWYADSRCIQPEGVTTCIAGCISNIRPCFSETFESVFPFAALPNRVDVTVKSFFWGFLEEGNANVFCTDEPYPRRSEIIHTYYYTSKVCDAANGAVIGAIAGATAGIFVGIAVAVAIGCASVILCALVILLAILIVLALALSGAWAGGTIAAANADDTPPSGSDPSDPGESTVLKTGFFITQRGNMTVCEEDNNANVLWFARETTIHGEAAPGTPQPFCYCEIDEQFTMDSCDRVVLT